MPVASRRRASRASIVAALLIATFVVPARADKAQCAQDHASGQRKRRAGGLRAARQAFLACASPECPSILQTECATWLAEVEGSLPTIVVDARSSAGRPVDDVRVSLDGEVLASKLTGVAIPVDPGDHGVSFATAGAPVVEQRQFFNEGDRLRPVSVVFGVATPRAEDEAAPSLIPPAAIALGAVGAVGFASFATFGILAKLNADELDQCRPFCKQDEIDTMRTQSLIADVSLGIGVLGLGAAALLVGLRASKRAQNAPAIVPLTAGAAVVYGHSF